MGGDYRLGEPRNARRIRAGWRSLDTPVSKLSAWTMAWLLLKS
jgi:hypothetical protein